MRRMVSTFTSIWLGLGLGLALTVAGPASAETDVAKHAKAKAERSVKKVLKDCEKELNSFCSQVKVLRKLLQKPSPLPMLPKPSIQLGQN